MTNTGHTTGEDLVLALDGRGIHERAAVGGKAAGLGELIAAGFDVPAGYAVTTHAFRRAILAADPTAAIRAEIERLPAGDHAAIARVTAGLRHRIAAAPMPADVHAAIAGSYRLLRREHDDPAGTPVAVRSSATCEDGSDASFAGLQDTYLAVRGVDSVVDHVRRCWASLYNAESVTYRLRREIPEHALAMGVAIQEMVDPSRSGVMFTLSPATGDRSVIVIESTWGLGSALVGGEVTPDMYLVSKVTGEISRRAVSAKTRRHRMDPGGVGVIEEDMPAELRDRTCLSDDEIRGLARMARQVEDHYGSPQDIEWTIAPDGPERDRIFIVQSRPETVWTRRPASPVAIPRERAFDHVLEHLSRAGPRARKGGQRWT